MTRRQRWTLLLMTLAILVIAVLVAQDGELLSGVAFGVLAVLVLHVYSWWARRRGRHTPWERATAQIAPDHAVVLWKPGCLYCERLLLQLRSDSRVTWVNVWQDEEANAQVRAVNNGNELTPTVLLGDQILRNPTAAELRERLTSAGPAAGRVQRAPAAQSPSAT